MTKNSMETYYVYIFIFIVLSLIFISPVDCTYGVFPGKKVSLISGQSTIKQSVDECINACNADSNCQSLTYSKGKQCTTFTAKYSSNLEDNVDVTYYEQYNCRK